VFVEYTPDPQRFEGRRDFGYRVEMRGRKISVAYVNEKNISIGVARIEGVALVM